MRYILKDGYIDEITFGATIECKNQTCTEYAGTIPTGYTSLEEWVIGEAGKLNAWKIIDGNLVFDESKYKELKEIWEKQEKDNSPVYRKEIFGLQQQIEDIQDMSNSNYSNVTSNGKIIITSNAKKCFPKIKITDIANYDYDNVSLFITGINQLKNEAVTQTINGIDFTQNEDRSINISGTSTAAIEYNIAGTSNNTSAFLCLKKGLNYYLSGLENLTIKMYYYDGTDREEVYSGTGGEITFTDSDKLVTQIVLSIASGKKINNVTIYPQLEYGISASPYNVYNEESFNINFNKFIEEALFPSDTLYPSDDVFPKGTKIDLLIENSKVYVSVNDELKELENINLVLSSGSNTIFTLEDTLLEVTYCIDNLDYMKGKSTSTNKFKVLEDGSIEANNASLSGSLKNYSNNNLAIEIKGTDVNVYDWRGSGSIAGSLSSVAISSVTKKNLTVNGDTTFTEETYSKGLSLYTYKGNSVSLGYKDNEDSSEVHNVISFDTNNLDDTPFIINTANGNLFKYNADGFNYEGITVQNGLIKKWGRTGYTGYVGKSVPRALYISNGLIVGVET